MNTNDNESSSPETPRRDFMAECGALIVSGIVGVVPAIAGLAVFLDPLLRKPKVPKAYEEEGAGGKEGFLKVCNLDAVPADGIPRRYAVIADKIDAWTFSPDEPIGAIYMSRDKETNDLKIFHSICPHAGCSVAPSPDNSAYLCPCHNSSFNLDGSKLSRPGKDNPSPRPLDKLDHDEDKLSQDGEIWVRFENYYTGIHEKKAKL